MQTRTWIQVTIALALLAISLQVAGFLAPMWIWLDVGDFNVGVGLWFSVGCGLEGTCNTTAPPVSFGYNDDDVFANSEFKAVQALETLGTIGGVLVLLFQILYMKGYGQWKIQRHLHLAAFWTCIVTSCFILIGVVVYCAEYWTVVGTSPSFSDTSFPWSMLMCILAGLLFVVLCVLIRLKCWDTDFAKNAIPMAGTSQMNLYPFTKQGLFHRFFTPAYHETRRPNYAIERYNEGTGMFGTGDGRLSEGGAVGRRAIPAIDNKSFDDNEALDTAGVQYRFLPHGFHHGSPQRPPQAADTSRVPTQAPSIPANYHAQLSYTDDIAIDFRRHFPTPAPGRLREEPMEPPRRMLDEPPTNRVIPRAVRDVEDDFGPVTTRHDVTRSEFYNRGGVMGAAARDDAYVSRYVTSNNFPATSRLREESDRIEPPRHMLEEPQTNHVVPRRVRDEYDGFGGARTTRQDVTRSEFYNRGEVVGATRDDSYVARYVSSTRPGYHPPPAIARPLADHTTLQESRGEPYITRIDIKSPLITSGAYIAGVTDPPRHLILADNASDSRFTNDGRLTANADYLSTEHYGRANRPLSHAGSSHSGRSSALQYTTHVAPLGPATHSAMSSGGSSALLQPTTVIRPSSRQRY
ncbi:uncharacterized protein LOC143287684 [Babylonia areolata]|uniref:uncharacterized protein LOC143287684 n=1 Tax=Babylonia areolata TaxID=304850 RepID=UPI003FD28502